jgi:hypothetical protein
VITLSGFRYVRDFSPNTIKGRDKIETKVYNFEFLVFKELTKQVFLSAVVFSFDGLCISEEWSQFNSAVKLSDSKFLIFSFEIYFAEQDPTTRSFYL